ncbi:MAG: putative phage abortive infection protein [Cyclobacteriaceae bacterium]
MEKRKINFGDLFANILAVCALLAIGLGLWLSYVFIGKIQTIDGPIWEDHNLLGMAGEFLGGTVGSIWALAGVILFFLALIYQKRELVLQRMELHESRKIMESQSKTIAIQQFENTFFQLLNFHINAANQIRSVSVNGSRKSVNSFDGLFLDFKKETNALKKRRKSDAGTAKPSDESFEHCFIAVYEGYKNTFQHYLENYKTLLLFIRSKSGDPAFYYNILKSHFTEQEVLIHFYYVLLVTKNPDLKEIVEKYHLFQKLNQRAVSEIDPYHLQKLDDEAFLREF